MDVKAYYKPFQSGCNRTAVDAAVQTALRAIKSDMYGFNRRTTALAPFTDVKAFHRYASRRRGERAIGRLKAKLPGCKIYRLTLTVSTALYSCRVQHARALRRAARVMFCEIRSSCVGFVGALHVDEHDYLHWDVTVLVRDTDSGSFKHAVRAHVHETGWRRTGMRRAYSCYIKAQGLTARDLERSVDYTLKHDRYKRHATRTDASIRALGVARASGFTQVTKSFFGSRTHTQSKCLKANRNQAWKSDSVGAQGIPMTKGTFVRVSSPKQGTVPTKPRPRGRPRKIAGKAYRRDRLTRVHQAGRNDMTRAAPKSPLSPRLRAMQGVIGRCAWQLCSSATFPPRVALSPREVAYGLTLLPSTQSCKGYCGVSTTNILAWPSFRRRLRRASLDGCEVAVVEALGVPTSALRRDIAFKVVDRDHAVSAGRPSISQDAQPSQVRLLAGSPPCGGGDCGPWPTVLARSEPRFASRAVDPRHDLQRHRVSQRAPAEPRDRTLILEWC